MERKVLLANLVLLVLVADPVIRVLLELQGAWVLQEVQDCQDLQEKLAHQDLLEKEEKEVKVDLQEFLDHLECLENQDLLAYRVHLVKRELMAPRVLKDIEDSLVSKACLVSLLFPRIK